MTDAPLAYLTPEARARVRIDEMLRAAGWAVQDSAGVNLPHHVGVFPGPYGAARTFYYNSLMRRLLKVPQIAAVMGPCIAGGAYLPALSDVILMGEGTSFMGLGGPHTVKGATGQVVEAEELGGAHVHTEVSAVAHYLMEDDATCLERLRQLVSELPDDSRPQPRVATPPTRLGYELYDLNLELPLPLVPRHLRFDVPERMAADGAILRALDEGFVRRLVTELRDKGIKAIAVSYLNSFRNPVHERRTREIIGDIAPEIRVSISSEVVAEIREFQRLVRRVPISDPVLRYALSLVRTTRPGPNGTTPDFVKQWVSFGASVRAAQYLVLGGKARALTSGRYHVSFEDIRALAHPVLRHRIITNFHAQSEGITTDLLTDRLLEAVPLPRSGM